MSTIPIANGAACRPRWTTRLYGTIGLTLAAGLIAGCGVLAQEKSFDTPVRPTGLGLVYPSGSIVSTVLADQALTEATAERNAIEARYLTEQAPCFARFFVTRCTDAARERRRIALAEVRAVEVEADYIKRRDRADERDKAIAERTAQEAAEAPQREKDTAAREKAATDKAAQRAADQAKEATAQQHAATLDPAERQRKHDAATQTHALQDASERGVRAAKVSAYQQKQLDAAKEQQRVAEKKVAKAAEAKLKADQAAASAAATAAATTAVPDAGSVPKK